MFLTVQVKVVGFMLFGNDPFYWKQASNQLNCSTVTIIDEFVTNGSMPFMVAVRNPYKTNVSVSKTPIGEGDAISQVDGFVIWEGTIDLTMGKGLSKTTFAFFAADQAQKEKKNTHLYNFECHNLDLVIEANLKKWSDIEEIKKSKAIHFDFVNLSAYVVLAIIYFAFYHFVLKPCVTIRFPDEN